MVHYDTIYLYVFSFYYHICIGFKFTVLFNTLFSFGYFNYFPYYRGIIIKIFNEKMHRIYLHVYLIAWHVYFVILLYGVIVACMSCYCIIILQYASNFIHCKFSLYCMCFHLLLYASKYNILL
jgi:hypothetical protein